MEVLKRLNQQGHTIIIITHSMELAAEYADRTIILKDGQILWTDRPEPSSATKLGWLRLPSSSSLVRLSNWLGTQGLTVEQMVKELKDQG